MSPTGVSAQLFSCFGVITEHFSGSSNYKVTNNYPVGPQQRKSPLIIAHKSTAEFGTDHVIGIDTVFPITVGREILKHWDVDIVSESEELFKVIEVEALPIVAVRLVVFELPHCHTSETVIARFHVIFPISPVIVVVVESARKSSAILENEPQEVSK